MAMSRSFIGKHRSRFFKFQITIFLGIDLFVAIFANHTNALVCIHVGECPTFGGFSVSYVGNMTPNLGLDWGTNANGCCISQFTFPLIPMDVD
jgi:hypothetical protein